MPCINLYRTTACDAKNDKRKLNTIASYATKKFGFEYRGFLLRFCTHRNEFNCVFRSKKLRKYAIRSLIWSYAYVHSSFAFTLIGKRELVALSSWCLMIVVWLGAMGLSAVCDCGIS